MSQRKLSSAMVDEFYYTPPSAMCPFSAKSIEVKNSDRILLKQIPFHFLHGELVGVVYYADQNTIEVNLHGFIRSKKDYRYLYDNDD